MQSFPFDKLTTKIKKWLVILENVGNFWAANLKVYDNYNSRTPLTIFSSTTTTNLPDNSNNGSNSTLEHDTYACNEFIAIIIKNENLYVIVTKDNKRQRTHEIPQKLVTLIW